MEPGNDVEEAEAPGDVASMQEEQAAGQPPASNLEEEEVVEGDDTCVRGGFAHSESAARVLEHLADLLPAAVSHRVPAETQVEESTTPLEADEGDRAGQAPPDAATDAAPGAEVQPPDRQAARVSVQSERWSTLQELVRLTTQQAQQARLLLFAPLRPAPGSHPRPCCPLLNGTAGD